MSDISKHDPEQKGERNTCEHCWVDLAVSRSPVSIDNFLERPSHIISVEESRRVQFMVFYLFNLQRSVTYSSLVELVQYGLLVRVTPYVASEDCARLLHHIQSLVG